MRSAAAFIFLLFLFFLPFAGGTPVDTDLSPAFQMPILGPDGNPLPFQSYEEICEFLLKADVVESKRIGAGVNNPFKVLLELDGIQAHAVFRDVRIDKFKAELPSGTRYNFRDDALFEIAAYRLARLLDLDNVPPVVERRLFDQRGSLQIWIEKSITEKKRIEKDTLPADLRLWRYPLQTMRIFDNLIYNVDRNQGNILFDSAWKLWMIDHTRAFGRDRILLNPPTIIQCERRFWDRLRALDEDTLKKAVGRYLKGAEIRGLLLRRDLIVRRLDDLIEKRGTENVVFDFPSRDAGSDVKKVMAATELR